MIASANMRFTVLVNLATIILRVTTSSSKSHFTCNAGTYFPGDEGYVICHFGRDIHNSTYHFEIVMHRIGSLNSENGRDVLRCHWLEDKRSCRTAQGFEFDDDILDNITVRISKVTSAFEGLYACQLIPPGLSTVVPCTLQVTDPTPALPALDVTRTLAIVLLGVSTPILLILTGCIFIVRRKRRQRQKSSDAEGNQGKKPPVPQESPTLIPAVHPTNAVLKTVGEEHDGQEETDSLISETQEDLDEAKGEEKKEARQRKRKGNALSEEVAVVAAVKRIGVQHKLKNREFPWDGSVEDLNRHMKPTENV